MCRKVIAVDLDGVLCEDGNDFTPEGLIARKPIKKNIEKINRLFEKGHIIIIYTSRNDKYLRPVTEAWLRMHGVKFHALVMSKFWFDVYIDEKKKLIAIEDLNPDKFE